MENNLPQLNITLDALTSTVLVEEPRQFPGDLRATLTEFLGPAIGIACAAPSEILAPPITTPAELAAGTCVRISGYWHNSAIEGPGRRSTAKLQGCTIHCIGCI